MLAGLGGPLRRRALRLVPGAPPRDPGPVEQPPPSAVTSATSARHPCPWPRSADLVGQFLNNASAIYEMGPVNVAMERHLVRWMAGLAGWGPGPTASSRTAGRSAI